MNKIVNIARAVVWLWPASTAKNAALRTLGHDIHFSAVARSSIVWKVNKFTLSANSRFGRFNLVKNLREIHLGASSSIGRLNVISSHPVYTRLYPDGAALQLHHHAKITSKHHLDCSGGVIVGNHASVAGSGSTLLTHSVDLRRDAQVAWPILVGNYSFVGTHCVLLGGAALPDRSVLGAGSVLNRSREPRREGLWIGIPAQFRGSVEGDWFDRDSTHTTRVFVPASGTTVEGAL